MTANTALPPGLEVTVAGPEDYEGIMDIDRNMYGGYDYIPVKYMEYVNNPNRLCVVVKKDGKPIAFGMNYVVDEGKTLVRQAGRVHEDHQGFKYVLLIQGFSSQVLLKKYQLERIMWTSHDIKICEGLLKRHNDVSMVALRPIFPLEFSPAELELALKSAEFQDLQKMTQQYSTVTLTPSGVKEVMSKCPHDVAAMLPEGFWIVHWEPFQPMNSNYDLITKDSTVYVTMATNSSLMAVSYGTSVKVKAGLRYYCDYYVLPEHADDVALFMSHFMRYLIHVHQFHRGSDVALSVVYPKTAEKMVSNVKTIINTKLNIHRKSTTEFPCMLMKKNIPLVKMPVSNL